MSNSKFLENFVGKLLQASLLLMISMASAQGASSNETQIKRIFVEKGYVQFESPIKMNMKEKLWKRVGRYFEKYPTIDEFNQKEPSAVCPSLYMQCYLDVDLDIPQPLLGWNYYYVSEDAVKEVELLSLKGRLDFFMRGTFPKLTWLSNPRVSGSIVAKRSKGIKQSGFIIASKQALNITSKDVTDKTSFDSGLLSYTPLKNKLLKGKPYEVNKFMKPKKAIEFQAGNNSYLLIKWMGFSSPCMSYTEVFEIKDKELFAVNWDISGCDI